MSERTFETEDEFIEYNSYELMEGIAELGYPEIRKQRRNIKRAIYYIVKEYAKAFRLEKSSKRKEILLISSDIVLGLVMYFLAVTFDAGTTGKGKIFGYEIGIFVIILILFFLIFLFFTARLYAK